MNRFLFFLMVLIALNACTKTISGPINVQAIRSVGHCEYSADIVTVNSLTSIEPLRGLFGSFVSSSRAFAVNEDYYSPHFSLVPTRFFTSGNNYYPRDFASLVGVSIYHYLERVQQLFAGIDSRADLVQAVPNLPDTLIYYRGTVTNEDGDPYADNAAYVNASSRNFLFTFPNQEINSVPLSLNPGVLGHEITHFVSQYLWRQSFRETNTDSYTRAVMDSIDEGFSDYVGMIISEDPGFFTCSFPEETARDLRTFKSMSQLRYRPGSANYDVHLGGAVWAAVQYQIGSRMNNHIENLRTLVQMFSNLQNCGGANQLTFASLQQCHLNLVSGKVPDAAQIYNQAFDVGGL